MSWTAIIASIRARRPAPVIVSVSVPRPPVNGIAGTACCTFTTSGNVMVVTTPGVEVTTPAIVTGIGVGFNRNPTGARVSTRWYVPVPRTVSLNAPPIESRSAPAHDAADAASQSSTTIDGPVGRPAVSTGVKVHDAPARTFLAVVSSILRQITSVTDT